MNLEVAKLLSVVGISTILMSGCGSNNQSTLSTVQATDFAMSCDALIAETKNIKISLGDEENTNLAKNVIGKVLTMGIYSAGEEDEVVLRERIKSLQLIYAMKQAKNECRALTENDVKVDNVIVRSVDEVKDTVKKVTN